MDGNGISEHEYEGKTRDHNPYSAHVMSVRFRLKPE